MSTQLYDTDFFKWTEEQIASLKLKRFDELDMDNLIEEIEDLGGSKKSAIESHMETLLLHLLKQEYQRHMNCKSWEISIKNAKHQIRKILRKNPSLKNFAPETIPDAFESARLMACKETGLDEDTFPKDCPWTMEDLNIYEEKK